MRTEFKREERKGRGGRRRILRKPSLPWTALPARFGAVADRRNIAPETPWSEARDGWPCRSLANNGSPAFLDEAVRMLKQLTTRLKTDLFLPIFSIYKT